jgi:hypothetical protein
MRFQIRPAVVAAAALALSVVVPATASASSSPPCRISVSHLRVGFSRTYVRGRVLRGVRVTGKARCSRTMTGTLTYGWSTAAPVAQIGGPKEWFGGQTELVHRSGYGVVTKTYRAGMTYTLPAVVVPCARAPFPPGANDPQNRRTWHWYTNPSYGWITLNAFNPSVARRLPFYPPPRVTASDGGGPRTTTQYAEGSGWYAAARGNSQTAANPCKATDAPDQAT